MCKKKYKCRILVKCHYIWILIFLFPAASVFSQPRQPEKKPPEFYEIKSRRARDAYEQAILQMGYRSYAEAINTLDVALADEPAFALALYRKAECMYFIRRTRDLLPVLLALQKLKPQGDVSLPHFFFYLGQGYFFAGKYAEAANAYPIYLGGKGQNAEYKKIAQDNYEKAKFAADALAHPLKFEPKNLGSEVNSAGEDFIATLTADDRLLFFTSRRPGTTGEFDYISKDYFEDFYYSVKSEKGEWAPAENLGPPINTEGNEGAACIAPDGQQVFFTACGRKGNVGGCDLYVANLKGLQWSAPRNLGATVNSVEWDSHPNLSHDGRQLFFASARSGGLGGTDLYVSHWQDGTWSAPQNLNAPVNTSGNEYGPFLAADGNTLYFASDGHQGFGGTDLFMTVRQADGSWSKPRNLGYPLNTPANEQNLFINAAGTQGYVNTDARGGFGKSDLYTFEVDSSIRPAPATFVRGLVTDSLTGRPVTAQVAVVDLTSGDTLRWAESNAATGRFLISLPYGREYAAYVDATGYLFYSRNFALQNLADKKFYDLRIRLQPLRAGATVVLNNIFFDTNESTLKAASRIEVSKLLRFLQSFPKTVVELAGHTDNVGAPAFNQQLSQRRAEAVRTALLQQGISAQRLQAKGYGETKPVSTNDNDTGRALNRRTEFRILKMN